ncbi:uncharacterized protein L201_003172 [Kwoniella dendrophila CBS 6074]|uniref:Zn(2)-C6 fungal-type domain-containing protein n=1 Tax=Kwoniella dendrophila CBS 6074 TaxID=1295534 RepID=A0AAX4JUN5_9TREE
MPSASYPNLSSSGESSRRRKSISPPPPPLSSRTRIFHACQSCASSKVKCEGLRIDGGCARCRRRNTKCSLAGLPGLEDIQSNNVDEEEERRRKRRRRSKDIHQSIRNDNDDNIYNNGRRQSENMFTSTSTTCTTSSEIYEMKKRIESLEIAYQTFLQQVNNNLPSLTSPQITYSHSEPQLHSFPHPPHSADNNLGNTYIPPPSSIQPSTNSSSSYQQTPNTVSHTHQTSLNSPNHSTSLQPPPTQAPTSTSPQNPKADSPSSSNNTKHGFYVKRRPLDIAGFQKGYAMDPVNITFDETARCAVDFKGYPDIVSRGYVTRSHVESNFLLFKHRFSLISPLPQFLLTTRSIPSHPFIQLASLAFLHQALPIEALGLIEESILYSMSGPSCTEAILSLYILSFSPFPLGSENHIPPTCLRFISLAYSLGVDLGLETKAEIMLKEESNELLKESWMMNKFEELTLWEAVKNRYCILKMECARCRDLPRLYSLRFPIHPSDHINQCIIHLQQEQKLVDACREYISTIAELEVTVKWEWPDLDALGELWNKTKDHLDELMDDLDDDEWLLRSTIACIGYSIGFRLSFMFHKPPSPISITEIEKVESLTGIALVSTSNTIIEQIIPFIIMNSSSSTSNIEEESKIDLPLPAALITALIICLATSRRIQILIKQQNILPNPLFNEEALLKAENFIAKQPNLPGKVLRDMWISLQEPQRYLSKNNQKNNNNSISNHNTNHMDSNENDTSPYQLEEFQSVWTDNGFNWDLFNFDFVFQENSLVPNTSSNSTLEGV